MPASSEFIAICRSQVVLLTQSLGAAFSVVYLTEELVEGVEAKLIPVVAYPETAAVWTKEQANQQEYRYALLPQQTQGIDTVPKLISATASQNAQMPPDIAEAEKDFHAEASVENSLMPTRQLFLPLLHEGVMLGLLVTSREDRSWNHREITQIERIAQTLSLSCILDQRRAWFEQRLSQQQRLQAQQRNILDDLIHQFRNPLTALRTFGKLLLKRLGSGEANREVANSIVRESDRLQEMLQQFDSCLDLTPANLEPPNLKPALMPSFDSSTSDSFSLISTSSLQLEPCSVQEVLEPLLVSASAIAQERNLNLITEIPPKLPNVQANPQALREVLSNLLDNALKYTPAGGRIDVKVTMPMPQTQSNSDVGNYQAIAISDTGYGIPPADLEHIFERHYRGVQAQTGIPGTGLGLAIAKELVERMDGDIEVISPAEPSWTVGGVLLPPNQSVSAVGTTVVVWLALSNSRFI
ncbi:MAG: HAMP domain-containing sensor histidine kinase [Crinalium sp.]